MPAQDEELYVPDRYEGLRGVGEGTLQTLVHPVEEMLRVIDDRWAEMASTRRGTMMLLRGDSGTGKTTFLSTVGIFRAGVETARILADEDIRDSLQQFASTENLRIVVIEGREALTDTDQATLEAAMHSINGFLRSEAGSRSLVVWTVNTDELMQELSALGGRIGAESLFGLDGPRVVFPGPPRSAYVQIAASTIAALNEGATLTALGVTDEAARDLAQATTTRSIGHYMGLIGRALRENTKRVRELQKREQVRLWVLVISGTDAEGDVAGLTRGGHAYIDIDRLMNATAANVIKDLKKYPDTLGILGTLLDAKIIYMDAYTALSIARTHGGAELKHEMQTRGMSIRPDKVDVVEGRVQNSQLGVLLTGEPLGLRRRGTKPGGGTQAAFENLSGIASVKDGLANKAIGDALMAYTGVTGYQPEHPIEGEYKYTSDLLINTPNGDVRLEVMWRKRPSRAEIANYTLSKLANYAKALGLIS